MNTDLLYKATYAIFKSLASKVSEEIPFPEDAIFPVRVEEVFIISKEAYERNILNGFYSDYIKNWKEGVEALFGTPTERNGEFYIDPIKYAKIFFEYNKLTAPEGVRWEETSPYYLHPKRFGLENEPGITEAYIAAGMALAVPLIMDFMVSAPTLGEGFYEIPHWEIDLSLYRVEKPYSAYNILLDGDSDAFKYPAGSPREAVLMLIMTDLILALSSPSTDMLDLDLADGLNNCIQLTAGIYRDLEVLAGDYPCKEKKINLEYFLTNVVPYANYIYK